MVSFFIVNCQLKPEIETSDVTNNTSFLQKGTPNETVGMSGETPKLKNTKTLSLGGCNIEDFIASGYKSVFMKEIYELKQEVEARNKVCCGESFFSNNKNNIFENLELQFFLLQQGRNFLKTEINQKQKPIDKLLDLNWLRSKDQCKVNDGNKTVKKNVEIPQLHYGNPLVNVYDVNMKQSHSSGNPENANIKIKSNGDSKAKIMIAGDFLVIYVG